MPIGKNVQLACNTTGTGIQAEVEFQQGPDNSATLVAQFSATGSFTVEVQIAPDAPWVTLGSAVTVTSVVNLTRAFTRYRINVSANTGTIKVWIQS